jgi:hypothetical protein
LEWMFVDTWYTIGPFPNPPRVNINTKWRINEGVRKVYFKKGINRILYRVENGPLGVYLSLGVQMPVQTPPE